MIDHANELRRYSRKIGHPAGDVPSVMLAAAEEIELLAARLEAAEKERDALRAKITEMEKTWLSPEGYHILMQEREDTLFQAEKMKQRAPCKDISMWPAHHTQPTQLAPCATKSLKHGEN